MCVFRNIKFCFLFFMIIPGGYFSTVSPKPNSVEKRLMIECPELSDSSKAAIKKIFTSAKCEEISNNEMDSIVKRQKCGSNDQANDVKIKDKGEILIYPPTGKSRWSINTEDFACLAVDQHLNNVIIDFYLKYLLLERSTVEQLAETHVFSTWFYERLTTLNEEGEKRSKLSAAQNRHVRVKNFTKDVNIFEKDFVIIPINQKTHWFLAIICFPSPKKPISMEAKLASGTEKEKSINLNEESKGDRDEAESDESDSASDDNESETGGTSPTSNTQTIKS